MASTIPPPDEILWCKDPTKITAWLASNSLGLEFYGSFLNYCARTMDKLKNTNGRLIKGHLDRLRVTLTQEPLDDAAVLHEMKFYHKRLYKTGLVKTGAYPLDELLEMPWRIDRAHRGLYNTVFSERRRRNHGSVSASVTTFAPAINGDTLAVVNGIAGPVSAVSPASPANVQQPGLLGQRPLPGGPLLSTLPIREQPLAVASLEASLPVVPALTPVSASPEQEGREHGALLLMGGQDQQSHDWVQDGGGW